MSRLRFIAVAALGALLAAALRAARTQLVALGGNEGYATFFAFGHSLRG